MSTRKSTQSLSESIQDFKSKYAIFKTNYDNYTKLINELVIQNQIKTDTYLVAKDKEYSTHLIGNVKEVKDVSGCMTECTKLYNCTGAVYDITYKQCALYSGDNSKMNKVNKKNKGRYLALKNQRISQIDNAWKKLVQSKSDVSNSLAKLNEAYVGESPRNTNVDKVYHQLIASYTNGKGEDMIDQVNNIEKSIVTTSTKKSTSFQLYNKNISLYIPLTLFAGVLVYGIYAMSSSSSGNTVRITE